MQTEDPFDAEPALARHINWEGLRYMVSREMFCPVCGDLLDVRRAVEWTVRRRDSSSHVECAKCFGATARRALQVHGREKLERFVEVIDGTTYEDPITGDPPTNEPGWWLRQEGGA